MQFLHPTNTPPHKSAGFTLVEILVIAPIVMLALGGFIALMVTMVGDVLATRDQNMMTYESQDTLSLIESDVKLSVGYLTTTGTLLSPQGSNDATSPFTNTTNTLILHSLATNVKPEDSARKVMYFDDQPHDCASTEVIFNQVYLIKKIYFIKNGSLWRRTAMPIYNVNSSSDAETICSQPWQKDSCSPGYTNTTRCDVNDMELMKNVTSMNVEYFLTPDSTSNIGAANAAQATTVKVTVNGSKTVAGRSIASSQSTRATRINAIVKPPLLAPLRFTTQPFSQTVVQNTGNVQFTATPSLSRATIQWYRQITTGGTWSPISGATSNTYTVGTATLGMNNYRYRAIATTPEGSATSNTAVLTVRLWGTLDLEQDWGSYDAAWGGNDAGYTKTTAGVVLLKGMLAKSSPGLTDETIGTLPPGYRPKGRQIFSVATYANESGRVDVLPTGEIIASAIDSTWVSLESIRFIPADTSYTFNALPLQNGWANYGGSFGPAEYVYDNLGRVHTQGLVRYGTVTNDTPIANPTNTAHRATEYYHFPSRSNAGMAQLGANATGLLAKGGSNGYLSLVSMYDPTSATGWTTLTLQNGWTQRSGYALARYKKDADGIVNVKGLVAGGVTTSGTAIATLPAGYCPGKRMLRPTLSNGSFARVDIFNLSSGCQIQIITGVNSSFALDSITFLAER